MENPGDEESIHFLSLPVELLVYIISFLPTVRDKVKLRYVSPRLRVVSETPSLWREFVWPFYHRREERSVMSVLKDCGEYIKHLVFPDHVKASALIKMINYCNNVSQLSLAPGTKLDSKQLGIAAQSMEYLEKLEVQLSTDIKPLLQISKLSELTVHIKVVPRLQIQTFSVSCVQEWVAKGFVPCNLKIVVHEFVDQLRKSFIESWMQWNSTISVSHIACLKLYDKFRSVLNLSPVFPIVQLEFGQTATLPFVKVSNFGVLGFERDIVLLTDSIYNNKTTFKAEIVVAEEFNHVVLNDISNRDVTSLNFVTDFDFSLCTFLHSGHLEQLAIACPNLQHLNLIGNSECLRSLKGLNKIAQNCSDIRGLNLLYISLDEVEDHILLWDILCDMKKLTFLAVEVCLFGTGVITNILLDVHTICTLFSKFTSLHGLEIFTRSPCMECLRGELDQRWVWVFLSKFPSLRHCILDCDDPHSVQDIIADCEKLTHLSCRCCDSLWLTSACNSNLQQLSIVSDDTDIPDIFLETVSAHGELVRVAIFVNSVTIKGITSLIENSHQLLTLVVVTTTSVCNERGLKVKLKKFKSKMKKKYPYRKLFNVGTFKMVQNNELAIEHFDDYLRDAHLTSLWL